MRHARTPLTFVVEVTPPSSIKRKRIGSPTPPPLSTPTVVPPSPAALSHNGPANGTHHGADMPEGKRAKITLKVNAPAKETTKATPQSQPAEVASVKAEEPTSGRGLSRGIRQALSLVIKE